MDLDAATGELYQLPPEQFIARRTEMGAQARASGDGAARAAIGALRRPTVAAWAVNLLVQARPVELAELIQLAESLRTAQRELDTDELRRLTTQRRAAVAALVSAAREATKEAGRPVSDPVLLEVQATLDAAIADAGAQRAVLSGRLTTSLSYSGFGGVDLADAVAGAPPSRPRLKVVREVDDSAVDGGRAQAVADAQQALAEITARCDEITARRAEVIALREELAARAEQLRTELQRADRDLRTAEGDQRSAQRRLDAARRTSASGRRPGRPVT